MPDGQGLTTALPPSLEEAYQDGWLVQPEGVVWPLEPDGVERSTADTLARLATERDARSTLETGLGLGLSAAAIASVHGQRGTGEHVCIDPYQASWYDGIGVETVRRAKVAEHLRLIEEPSEVALPRLLSEGHRVDLAFIDGEHLYDFVMLDFFYSDRMLEVGGVIALHDTWMASVQRAVAFVLANRQYERLDGRTETLERDENLALLVKRAEDDRQWDFDRPFAVGGQDHRPSTVPSRRPRTQRATLSLCMTSGRRPAQARAILELLRPHVDEIVLAVNRDSEGTLEACGDLADRYLTYELPGSPSRLVGWIHGQCESDWILQLDDDDVPGTALLEALPDLIGDRWTTSYRIRRHWLYPSAEQWLAGMPWEMDWQSRLIRNLPGLWKSSGSVHASLQVDGECRFLDLPYYHLDLLMNEPEAQREKVEEYQREGTVHFEDYDVNDLYFPESFPQDRRPVPPADVELIRGVLEAPAPPRIRTPAAEHAEVAEIESWSWARTSDPDDWRGEIRFLDPRPRVTSGGRRQFLVRIDNLGREIWPAAGPPHVWIALRWRDRDGGLRHDGERYGLSCSIHPARAEVVPLQIEVPPFAGDFILQASIEMAGIGQIAEPTRTEVEITRQAEHRRESVMVGNEPLRRAVDELSAELRRARRQADRVPELEADVLQQDAQLQSIISGRRYRLGSFFAWPVTLRRRLRERRTKGP